MSSQKFLARNGTKKAAFVFHGYQASSFLKKKRCLIKVTWTVIILLTINFNVCASERLLYKYLEKRLLTDGTFHTLNELLNRCFDGNRRLLTIASEGLALPEQVIREAHSKKVSSPLILIRGDNLKDMKIRTSETSEQPSDMFILFVDVLDQVEPLLDGVKSLPLWNPRGRFVVVISHPLLKDREVLIENIFQRMWSEKILEVVIVFRFVSSEHCNEDTNNCSSLTSDMHVATYNPFRNVKGINYITGTLSKTSDVKVLFPSLSDVLGYPLRAAMFTDCLGAVPVIGSDGKIQRFEGFDGHTLQSLAKYMNAVIVFVPQNDHTLYGTRAENGTITGASGDVAYGRADIASNSQFVKLDMSELEYTYPHDTNNLCFLAPKAKRVPQFRNLFLPFPYPVWIALCCAMCLTSVCWYCVRKYGEISAKRRSNRFTINEAFFDIFRTFITGTFNEVPGSILGRVFIVTWLLLAIVIINAFQGSLTSYLAVPKYLPEINTIKKLDKSGLGIFVSPGVKYFLTLDVNDKIMSNLWRKFKHRVNISISADRIARERDMAGMFYELNARYYLRNKLYVKDGYPLLHRVQENILSVYSVYAVPRHSPFLHRFNAIIGRLVEAGLQVKWIEDSLHRATLDGRLTAVSNSHAAEPAPLGLAHLQTAFYFLMFGLLCSTLVFLLQRKMQAL
jgi:hypothetical protein